jgi:UDP-glucose 4-epimerase
MGDPAKIIVFSRDEAKQHAMRMEYQNKRAATDEIIYRNFEQALEFRIGDVRDRHSVTAVLQRADIVFNTAALKQVPTCEYFPYEGVKTNIIGPENIVAAIEEHHLPVETVIGVSTDKACRPINVMGMTKAIQERVFIQANIRCPGTRFLCARYGNVLASRGSVIPLFREQIRNGGPVTITTAEMTRFLLSLDDAVDTIFAAYNTGLPGEIYIPRAASALVTDIAAAMIGGRGIEIKFIGIRPGEKVHEILISDEEAPRTVARDKWFAILPMLPEVCGDRNGSGVLFMEYSSADTVMTRQQVTELLIERGLIAEEQLAPAEEVFV